MSRQSWRSRFFALSLAVIAIACSGSHHASQSPAPAAASDIAPSVGQDQWGSWVCTDKCGRLPAREFQIDSWAGMTVQDVCGTPWSCRYGCDSDCASSAPEESGQGDPPDPTVNVACLPFDGRGPVKYFRDITLARRGGVCVKGGVCYYHCWRQRS